MKQIRGPRRQRATFINPSPDNRYFAEVGAVAAVPTREAPLRIPAHLNAGTSDGVIVGSRNPRV